jgi:hypothetical protein
MWKYYEHNEKLENGDKVIVRIKFNDSTFSLYVDEIEFTPKGKRKSSFLTNDLVDRYDYRKLNMTDRVIARTKYFIHKVGIDVLNRSLNEAWESIKPNPIASEDYEVNIDFN